MITDHKPLEAIYDLWSKPCAYIERWVLRLQPYYFNVVQIPSEQKVADPLLYLVCGKKGQKTHKHEAEECARFMAVNATPRAHMMRTVEEASAEDDELKKVRQAIKTVVLMNASRMSPMNQV